MPDVTETTGYVERAILDQMISDSYRQYRLLTVNGALDHIRAVQRVDDRSAEKEIKKSSVRRAFNGLWKKDLIRRWEDVPEEERHTTKLRGLVPSEDGRVTDWVLTKAGEEEIRALDRRYRVELSDLLHRYGRTDTTKRL